MTVTLKVRNIIPFFQNLKPFRFTVFGLSNSTPSLYLNSSPLRIAVIDAPVDELSTTVPVNSVAAMFVPVLQESDWLFSTEQGNLQLLLDNPGFSRLILIGNSPVSEKPSSYIRPPAFTSYEMRSLETLFTPFVRKLCPLSSFQENGLPRLTFLTYNKQDDMLCRMVCKNTGIYVGDVAESMLIEDVQIKTHPNGKEFRRRLIFKDTPNVIQSQVLVVPSSPIPQAMTLAEIARIQLQKIKFEPDTRVLVQPYLTPMVTALTLIVPFLDEKVVRTEHKPRALCLGVGGGALVNFLNTQLDFEVVGVEVDCNVLSVARQYFGLKHREFVRLIIGGGIKFLKELACQVEERFFQFSKSFKELKDNEDVIRVKGLIGKFDVVMVDLVSNNGYMRVTAPPEEFFEMSVIKAAKVVLNEGGILVINLLYQRLVVYTMLVQLLRHNFAEVYEIKVRGEEATNKVLIAAASPLSVEAIITSHKHEDSFFGKLKLVISTEYINSIGKLIA